MLCEPTVSRRSQAESWNGELDRTRVLESLKRAASTINSLQGDNVYNRSRNKELEELKSALEREAHEGSKAQRELQDALNAATRR